MNGFDSKIAVRVMHHAYDRKAKRESVVQRMIAMDASISYSKFEAHVATCLGTRAGCAYSYVARSGRPQPISNQRTLDQW